MTFLPRRSRFKSISTLIVLAGFSIGALANGQDLTSAQSPVRRIEGGGPVDVKRLATGSSLIVRGRVVKGEPKWVGRVIYTFYELAVQETVKGLPRKTVSVAVPGGAIGNVQLIVPQAPALATGDELVFFGQNFAGERSAFQPTGAFDGLVPIRISATSQAAVAPRGKLEDLEEFLREVRASSGGR